MYHTTSRRHICRSYNLHPHQQRCVYKIIFTIPHTHLRRYTFLSHLTTKSKISVRWIKKLVAATYGVCMFIHKLSPPHITPIIIYPFIFATNAYVICNGGSHPAAIYVVCTIYTPPTMLCLYNITPKTSSLFAAIHFFTRSVTKSKMYTCAQPCEKEIYDFVFEHGKGTSPAKKMVAATFGVYMFIHISCLYN